MASQTSLGRVQPLFKGTYNSSAIYSRLDNVYYNGNTWVCKVDNVTGIAPASGAYWQQVASKGEKGDQGNTGSFGNPVAIASMVPYEAGASVSVTATGPDTAKVFNFNFDIPAGPQGFGITSAQASSLPAGSNATASASLIGTGPSAVLSFNFGIPAADGQGATSVDDVSADASGIVNLTAVKYGSSQSLSEAQKQFARNNIGAQASGDYIASPSTKTIGNYLRYEGNNQWSTHEVDIFPTGGRAGYYLQKTSNGTEWAPVYSVPSGGSINAVLTKQTASDYDLTWTTIDAIPSSDIDTIVSDT